MSQLPRHSTSRLAWAVWVVGIIAYIVAVINRSSFATLGTVAQHHFGIEATLLSGFIVLQVAVYALAQIPVGALLDRFGPSRLILAGLLIMCLGQVLLALAPNVFVGFGARVLAGCGDACIFISLIRLCGNWFSVRALPTVNQITGLTGQIGQLLSVVPLAALVDAAGWQNGFLLLALLCFVVFTVSGIVLRDSPATVPVFYPRRRSQRALDAHALSAAKLEQLIDSPIGQIAPVTQALPAIGAGGSGIFAAIVAVLKRPGVRLGFWIHLGTAAAMHTFALLWGTPFLVGGQHLTQTAAAALLSTAVLASMCGGIFLGPLIARFSHYRVQGVIGYICLLMLSWGVVLVWQGTSPLWLLYVTAIITGMGPPVSMVAFEVVRLHTHSNQLGVATGFTNMGAFIGTLTLVAGIGVLLDLQGAGSPATYSNSAFRVAMAWQYAVWLLAVVMICREWPRGKRELEKRLRRAGGEV